MKKVSLLLMLLVAVGVLTALSLTLSPSPELYNLFYASYVDPTDPMAQPILFHATFNNDTGSSFMYELSIDFTWNGNYLMDDAIATAENPLAIGTTSFTSRDIIAEDNDDFNSNITFDGILADNPDFEDAILNTGRFPDGNYTINIVLNEIGGNRTAQGSLVFNVVSPISIQLLYPGTEIGSDVMPYLEMFPNFIWASNLQGYTFLLWEMEGVINATAEDIENMTPLVECECTSATTLPYPPGAPTLEMGKTYAWQIYGGLLSPADRSGTSNILRSPVFVFRVANPDDNEVYNQILANFLNNIEGADLSEVYELLSQGFTPTGELTYMGQEMPFEDLNDLLILILNGELEFKTLSIE
ncbi:MAG: hypothetical protein K8R90_02550 [Candidatus Cloacimonetes bacterium]|nr:hypothetical protein [Candidatus Cloacimonadota bacterium]